jgi:diacylglycerol kinase (ATP)
LNKIRLIYNPGSGDRSFCHKLDEVIEDFQREGFQVIPYKTLGVDDIERGVRLTNDDDYYCIAVAGGDGTLNKVINAMVRYNINLPIGIFPWGTANDFAAYFGIPKDVKKCCSNILQNNIQPIDLGKINEKYFINVAAGGLLTDVSQKIDINLKSTLGKLAYYLKGIEQLPNFRPIPVKFINGENTMDENVYLFLAFNGCSAGGFNQLAKESKIDDGKLDIIAIRACALMELISLFIKLLKGEHLSDDNIIYLQTDKLSILCSNDVDMDIDGEPGPLFPIDLSIVPGAVRIFAP